MVPIHNTDLAEDRWSQAEWKNYELWEKVEQRLKRKKQLWVLVTCILFVFLSAIPIVLDKMPKWMGRSYARQIALIIHELKKTASLEKSPYRLILSGSGLEYQLEKVSNCDHEDSRANAPVTSLLVVKPAKIGILKTFEKLAGISSFLEEFVVLTGDQGLHLGVPGLIREVCYDPMFDRSGSEMTENFGFGVISVKDLAEKRLDRLTILLVNRSFSEIVFD